MPDDCWPGRVVIEVDLAAEVALGEYSVAPGRFVFEQATACTGGFALDDVVFAPRVDEVTSTDSATGGRRVWRLSGLGFDLRVTAGLWLVEIAPNTIVTHMRRLPVAQRTFGGPALVMIGEDLFGDSPGSWVGVIPRRRRRGTSA